ncbi:MAG TPA: glycosyltransferase family 4 protein [Solirubrobacteraceae bacterium]|nr:glycosyltransferase family 4 protein [Solirubrobacteraceae bacterium]
MERRPLHIAWIGFAPTETGGVPGVATDLLHGLASLGHRIDCYFAGSAHALPPRLAGLETIDYVWGESRWREGRWYSRTRLTGLASHVLARSLGSLRLRGKLARRHREDPYDVVYQFANVENLALPGSVRRSVPLVMHPETHSAGELRFLIAERQLSFRCQPKRTFVLAVLVLALRSRIQRRKIRAAGLLVGISSVFRDHMVADYGYPSERTVVVPNPVRLERFALSERPVGEPATVLVLGRVAARKGVEDVVALAKLMLARGEDVRFRVVGGTSLWSNYLKLLEEMPAENSEYVGRVSSQQVPEEIAAADVLLQASKYEPFALTVAEALAAGVPVVGTTEVGAVEGVDRDVAAAVRPGDVEGLAQAISEMLARSRADRAALARLARGEAERLFAPAVVAKQISDALEALLAPGVFDPGDSQIGGDGGAAKGSSDRAQAAAAAASSS